MKVAYHPDESSWLAARRKKLTSSDVPGLLGVYPSKAAAENKNPFALWQQKTGKAEPPEAGAMRLRFDLGHLVEPRVAREVEQREGVTLLDLGDYTTVEEGIFSSTPDRLIVPAGSGGSWVQPSTSEGHATFLARAESAIAAATGVCEIKSDGVLFDAETWSGGEKFDYALIQAHIPAMILAKPGGLIATVFGLGLDFDVWPFAVSEKLVSLIRERAEEFWECVLTDTPPGASFLDDSEAIGKSLAALYPKDSGETVELDEQAALQLEHYQELGKQIKALEATRQLIKNQVELRMESATWAKIPGSDKKWQWRTEPRKGYTVAPSEPRTLRVVKA